MCVPIGAGWDEFNRDRGLTCRRNFSALPPPRLLPVPFRDYVFRSLAHLHAVVEGGRVHGSISARVVPAQQLADLWLERLTYHLETGCTACLHGI